MKSPEDNLISVQSHKEVTRLYKSCLEILEDLKNDHEIMLKKIADKNGQEFADAINFFNQAKYEQIRKRILDHGNESLRQIDAFLEFFDCIINKERVEEAAKQRKVVKKFVINSEITIK